MLYTHVVALAILALCVAEDGTKRPARNPALLHLAHAGHSVGSYVAPETNHGGGRAVAGGGAFSGGAGPHIVIYGGHPAQVTTRVAGKDSLEELDEDIRQHYQQQGTPVRYVPNSSFQGHYFDQGRQNLDYSGFKDVPVGAHGGTQYTPGHDYTGGTSGPHTPGLAYPRTHGVYGLAPVLFNPQAAHAPGGHAFTRLSTYVGHPGLQSHTPQHSPTSAPAHYPLTGHTVTPATINYATPTPYPITPTATPLSHTLATPALLPARVPLHYSGQGGAAPVLQHYPLNGLRYHSPLSHGGPFFVPVQALGHHPQTFFQNQGHPQRVEYSPHSGASDARSQYKDEQRHDEGERPRYYDDAQERRPVEYQREYEEEEKPALYSQENADYEKSFTKYGSDESLPKSAATPSYQSYPTDDKGSFEDSSNEAGSGEKAPGFKYSFADDHSKGRSSSLLGDGEGKVATSYQSVTFETHHPIPRHYSKPKVH